MKIVLGLFSIFSFPTAFAFKANAVRRMADLYDEEDDVLADDGSEYSFLKHYEQIYMTCNSTMKVMNKQGEYEYGAVITRLCPNDKSCDKLGRKKCKGGYGDYVTGLETYMEEYLNHFQKEYERERKYNKYNKNTWDDEFYFNFAAFSRCALYEDNDDDKIGEIYIGPKCNRWGDLSIGLFTDDKCRKENPYLSFWDLTGVPLPWPNGIVEDKDCNPYKCYDENIRGYYEYTEFCTNVVDQASLKCEERMEYYPPSGQSIAGCDYIAKLVAQSRNKSGYVFVVILLFGFIACVGFFFAIQQSDKPKPPKPSAVNRDGLLKK